MKNEVHVTNRNQRRQSGAKKFMTRETRKRIRQLKRQLGDCNRELCWHLSFFEMIGDALDIARQSAKCLLADDPFEAWMKMANSTAAATSAKGSSSTVGPTGRVGKPVTRHMQQRVVDAKTKLENYANCLENFLGDLTDLESFDVAVELAEHLQFNEPLGTRAVQK